MKTVDEILALCGGPQAVCAALPTTRAAIRKWRQFGGVPGKHQMALLRLGAGRLAPDDLAAPAADAAPSGAERAA